MPSPDGSSMPLLHNRFGLDRGRALFAILMREWPWHVALALGYLVCWWSAFWLPKQLEVINYVASWYLPAGLRVTALVLLPFRWWPAVIGGEMGAMLLVGHPVAEQSSWPGSLFGAALPMICYGVPIYVLRRFQSPLGIDRVGSTFWIILTVSLSATLWGATMSGALFIAERIPAERFVSAWGGLAVGDGVAVTLVLPLTFLLVRGQSIARDAAFAALEQTVILMQAVFLVLLLVATYAAPFVQLAKFVALIPLMFLPYRFGWVGAVATVVALNVVVLIAYLTGVPFGTLIDNQVFLAFGGLSALLLGGAISEQRDLLDTLSSTNQELRETVERLDSQRQQSERLANRVVAIQEEERHSLSRELHDGIGQQASALRVNLSVLRKRLDGEEMDGVLTAMESITASMYSMARELVHRLRPRVLDDLGLRRSLEAPDIVSQLMGRGIAYHVFADIDEASLDEELTIAIYRLIQECVNNAAKHSGARNLWVELIQSATELRLLVRDDGVGIAPAQSRQGMGLTTIRDRVTALGGSYRLDTDHRGTRHAAVFSMPRRQTEQTADD